MNVIKNKQLARTSAFGWAVCVLVVVITVLAGPLYITASAASEQVGPSSDHKMTNSSSEHNMDMRSPHSPCENPARDSSVNCEKTCTQSCTVSCALSGGCGTSTAIGPTFLSPTVTPFNAQLSLTFSPAPLVSRQPDSLLRPPIE